MSLVNDHQTYDHQWLHGNAAVRHVIEGLWATSCEFCGNGPANISPWSGEAVPCAWCCEHEDGVTVTNGPCAPGAEQYACVECDTPMEVHDYDPYTKRASWHAI